METAEELPPEEEMRWPEEPVAEFVGSWSGPVSTFWRYSDKKYSRASSGGTVR